MFELKVKCTKDPTAPKDCTDPNEKYLKHKGMIHIYIYDHGSLREYSSKEKFSPDSFLAMVILLVDINAFFFFFFAVY